MRNPSWRYEWDEEKKRWRVVQDEYDEQGRHDEQGRLVATKPEETT